MLDFVRLVPRSVLTLISSPVLLLPRPVQRLIPLPFTGAGYCIFPPS